MSDENEIHIFKALNFIRDTAPAYAKAKAERVYLEAFVKTKKAILMKKYEPDYPSAAAQEREALAHPEYLEILNGLREATEQEEKYRWLIVAAQAKVSIWQTLEATRRMEGKVLG